MAAPISPIGPAPISAPAVGRESRSGGEFADIFRDATQAVGALRQDASTRVDQFLSGEGEDLHKTVLATQRAELALELFLQVRNKVVQAYQEVMRMQI
jgi:flagellar hook-basal body complex protein FliE